MDENLLTTHIPEAVSGTEQNKKIRHNQLTSSKDFLMLGSSIDGKYCSTRIVLTCSIQHPMNIQASVSFNVGSFHENCKKLFRVAFPQKMLTRNRSKNGFTSIDAVTAQYIHQESGLQLQNRCMNTRQPPLVES